MYRYMILWQDNNIIPINYAFLSYRIVSHLSTFKLNEPFLGLR